MTAAWIAFEDQMPTPPHGRLLVTNNVGAKDAQGFASHVWLVSRVRLDNTDPVTSEAIDCPGEVTAFSNGLRLRNLTHWRPALPEEWPIRMDWLAVEKHLRVLEACYRGIGEPLESVRNRVLQPLRDRWNAGERTEDLAREILEFSL